MDFIYPLTERFFQEIKMCAHPTCKNFFSVGFQGSQDGNRRQKYCCLRCGDTMGKRTYKIKNKEKYLAQERKRRRKLYRDNEERREHIKAKKRADYAALSSEERTALYLKRKENGNPMPKSYHNDYMKKRCKTDAGFRIMVSLRSRARYAVKAKDGTKAFKTTELIGCSVQSLRNHLEEKFKNGMSWDNYGDWHIDHIIPCAAFDLTRSTEQKKCFHYTNLQPLWAHENLSKGAKYG